MNLLPDELPSPQALLVRQKPNSVNPLVQVSVDNFHIVRYNKKEIGSYSLKEAVNHIEVSQVFYTIRIESCAM